jgi:hypothetical protein
MVRHEIDVQSLWAKYEDIAMHFNDLLIRLRTQSLAGVAAISTIVGIFSKDGGVADISLDWVVAEAIFAAMIGFWIAIWCLDMLYYNRLLSGAVNAIIRLEDQTKPGATFDGQIDMSTAIKQRFKQKVRPPFQRGASLGILTFYFIVFGVLVAGFLFAHAQR